MAGIQRPAYILNLTRKEVLKYVQIGQIQHNRGHKMAKEKIEPRYLNSTQAAQYINISPKSFQNLREQGLFTVIKFPGMAKVLFDKADLDKTIEQYKIG